MARAATKILLAAAAISGAIAFAFRDASGHLGSLPVAVLNDPDGTGTLVDQSYLFHWYDSDRAVLTGTATINVFYTDTIPETFPQGVIPETLTGTAIVRDILETDTANSYTWTTTAVPVGTYWLWSRVIDPPTELSTIPIVTFSPGVLTVHHGGPEPMPPSVVITRPDSPFRYADVDTDLEYSAFDPDGSGRVKLEAWSKRDKSDLILIADDLPAVPNGLFTWRTLELPEGDYTLRASITDGRGMSFVAHGRYFLLITHLPKDAGVSEDAGEEPPPDAGTTTDTGGKLPAKEEGGCTCVTGRSAPIPLLALFLIFLRRKRA